MNYSEKAQNLCHRATGRAKFFLYMSNVNKNVKKPGLLLKQGKVSISIKALTKVKFFWPRMVE